MVYEKRVLVLKQTDNACTNSNKSLSAICRIEKEYGLCSLHLTTLNCPYTNGEYYLFVIDSSFYPHAFNLGKIARATGLYFAKEPNIEKGVAVGLCSVKEHIPLTIAFSKEDCFTFSKEQFSKIVAEYFIEERKNQSRKEREITLHQDVSTQKELEKSTYDDEAVATENYYENDISFTQNLKTFEDIDCGNLQLENDLPFDASQTEKTKNDQNDNCIQNETDLNKCKTDKSTQPYYRKVKNELTAIFSKFPKEECLEKLFCESSFVKINYSSDKFYVVGLIKEDKQEKYICYGVPGKYSPEPPKELKGYCTFIPLSIFNVCGDGYWMMFQDAFTGKCITPITA